MDSQRKRTGKRRRRVWSPFDQAVEQIETDLTESSVMEDMRRTRDSCVRLWQTKRDNLLGKGSKDDIWWLHSTMSLMTPLDFRHISVISCFYTIAWVFIVSDFISPIPLICKLIGLNSKPQPARWGITHPKSYRLFAPRKSADLHSSCQQRHIRLSGPMSRAKKTWSPVCQWRRRTFSERRLRRIGSEHLTEVHPTCLILCTGRTGERDSQAEKWRSDRFVCDQEFMNGKSAHPFKPSIGLAQSHPFTPSVHSDWPSRTGVHRSRQGCKMHGKKLENEPVSV
jgi:hypothetical protein